MKALLTAQLTVTGAGTGTAGPGPASLAQLAAFTDARKTGQSHISFFRNSRKEPE